MNISTGWTWELEDGSLCKYALASREVLIQEGKPSTDAKPVCVRFVRCGDYARLKAKDKNESNKV